MKALLLLLGTGAILSSAKEVAIDPTGERIPYEAANSRTPPQDGDFWKKFKTAKERTAGTANDDRPPGTEATHRRKTEETAEEFEPPKMSPVDDAAAAKNNPDGVPYERGGLLVANVLTGRSVAMAPQKNDGSQQEKIGTRQVIAESAEYLRDVVLAEDQYKDYYDKCVNKHELCSFWASEQGMQCSVNPNYMIRDHHCLLACKRCDKIPDGPGDGRTSCTDESMRQVQPVKIGKVDALGHVETIGKDPSKEEKSQGVQTVVI